MNRINWTAVAVFAIVTFLVFVVGVSLWGGGRYSGWGMMGPGMMGGWGSPGGWGFSPFGWIGMAFMWLIPIGFILLIVLGVVGLLRAFGGVGNSLPGRSCPNCGRAVQPDWRNCPHCGSTLTSA